MMRGLVVALCIGVCFGAADARAKTVRVGLFMSTPKYAVTTPSVTLSAVGGLTLSDDAGNVWETTGDSAVRVAIDGPRVVVKTTTSSAMARQTVDALRAKKQPAYVVFDRDTAAVHVELGPYPDVAAAEVARAAAEVGARIVESSYVMGPMSDSALGAEQIDALLKASQIASHVAIVWNGTTRAYTVFVGVADAARASALVQATWVPVAPSMRYVVLRTEQDGTALVRRWTLSPAHVWNIVPMRADSAVLVAERAQRQYRGYVELSSAMGTLAVINVVPLESYVASVVGSELDARWPEAALQAQAVAARTYVLRQGAKYGIAHVSDTTFDQVYNGIERESLPVRRAAEQTAGWKLVRADGTLQDAFFHSNAGNWTSDAQEVWNVSVPGIGPRPSPDDAAQIGKLPWFRVVTEDGLVGYVRSDVVQRTEQKTAVGWAIARVTGSTVNVRSGPVIVPDNVLAVIRRDARLTILSEEGESSAYRWIRGPFDAAALLQTMRATQVTDMGAINALTDLSVVSRGDTSGRVTLVAANGKPLIVARPDQYRTLLGLPSTRFDIENTAQVTARTSDATNVLQTVAGATVLSAQGTQKLASEAVVVADAARTARVVTTQQQFRFIGYGFGHGLGMSQWGAYSLAQLGYGVLDILRYYYPDAAVRNDEQ